MSKVKKKAISIFSVSKESGKGIGCEKVEYTKYSPSFQITLNNLRG
jgi:hypothetical protein